MTDRVPFFPPDMFQADRAVIFDLVAQVGREEKQILGQRVGEFEARLQASTGAAHAVAVSSGTSAVAVSLRALGIGVGDEVIVQAFCCQPVAEEVINLGARPVFVDVESATMLMDPARIEAAITPRTAAIMPAHLFCSMVNMRAVRAIADRHGLPVVEDACVQHGAVQDGLQAGRWGDLGTISFFQMKVMGGCGEGGAILSDDDELATRCRMLRNHGASARFRHDLIGVNARMDEIMAGYLLYRERHLDRILGRRGEIAAQYHERLAPIADHIVTPPPDEAGRCWYMFPIRTPRRDELQRHLSHQGIGSHVYYPRILPDQRAFRPWANSSTCLEVSRRVANENLALPIYPHLTKAAVDTVSDAVVEFFVRDPAEAVADDPF